MKKGNTHTRIHIYKYSFCLILYELVWFACSKISNKYCVTKDYFIYGKMKYFKIKLLLTIEMCYSFLDWLKK